MAIAQSLLAMAEEEIGRRNCSRLELVLVCLPLRLRCPFCGEVFGGEGQDALWQPCPGCGEQFGHVVEQGKELILSRLEAR